MATVQKAVGPPRSVSPPPNAPPDWILSNPWLWIPLGLSLTFLAFIMVRFFGDSYSPVRFTLLFTGLFMAAAGLVIRLKTTRHFLAATAGSTQTLLLLGLFLLYVSMAIAITVIAIACGLVALGFAWWEGDLLDFRLGGALVVWFVVVPASMVAAQTIVQHVKQKKVLSAGEETSILLLLCSVTLFLACWALYSPNRPEEWDTFRLLFGVFAAVAAIATILPALPVNARHTVISGLVLIHFGGICTATLSAPPFAWLTGQLWTRVYRPYLEFMYLNNAYHFYSPEPGPASYVWFALNYRYLEDDGKEYDRVHWVKIPDVDDNGMPRYVAGLTYQRYLSLTENVSHAESMPPMQVFDKNGQPVPAEYFRRRALHAFANQPAIVGVPQHVPSMIIPFANVNDIPLTQQYALPTLNSKRLIESFARRVCQTSIPDLPDSKVLEKRVKVYRVTHAIPYTERFRMGQDPQDPQLYRAYFMGEYDAKGELIDKEEPFLYWLLPNLAEHPEQRNSPVISYVRKHARDPYCRYLPEKKKWVKETP